MIKTLFVWLLCSIATMASVAPMQEQEAASRFAHIKQSQYQWVLDQWRKEMRIKINSRSSTRKTHADMGRDPLSALPGDEQKITRQPVDPITFPDRR